MNRPCLVVVAVIVLTLSLSACRCSTTPEATEAPPTATPTEEPIEPTEVPTEPPTETPEPTNTPEPTDTPPPTRSSAPQGSGQGPGAVWLPPIEAATLTLGAYEAILGTADELQIEGITGAEAFDEFLSEAVMLKAVGDTVAEWAPTEDQVHYKDALQGYISGAQEALGQWLDEEITPAEVRGLLESDYDALGDMTQGIVLAANQDGLELGAIEATLDELSRALEAAFGEGITIPLP